MYNKITIPAMTKSRYFFKKGYSQLQVGQKSEARKKLIKALGIKNNSYFSVLLHRGIYDITIYKYNIVTAVFAEYGIKDVWDEQIEANNERVTNPQREGDSRADSLGFISERSSG